MTRLTFFTFLLIVFVGTRLYAQTQAQVLDAAEFQAKIAATPDKVVLDVRTAPEYGQGHLPGAVMVDYNRSDFKQNVLKMDKNKPVFVYCAAGARSKNAAKLLVDLGFKSVFDLRDGLHAWKSAGLPIVK